MVHSGLWLALLVASLLGCGGDDASNECGPTTAQQCAELDSGMPNGGDSDEGETVPGEPAVSQIIVDTAWLVDRLGDSDVQTIDARGAAHRTSRIPGAISLVPNDLARTIDGVPGQLVPASEAEPTLRAAGLRNDTVAVVYGTSPEYNAARIVWALQYYGHEDVRYLDGGFDGWIAGGGDVESGPPAIEPTEYTIQGVVEAVRVTGDWVLEQLGDEPFDTASIQLVDARSEGEYGRGHIPTARSVDWNRNLDRGLILTKSELDALYQGLDPSVRTVTYCTSGQRGSFAWLALTALGFDNVALYDGSWNEWGTGDFPVEQ
jgi:thiosulfate/3-mercaptopyruvate sulfurtransferase